jgi:hypothetical protein
MTATPRTLDQRQSHQPRVSIVLTANAPRHSVEALIDIVRRHPRRDSLEVLVVSAGGLHDADVPARQSFVRHVAAPAGAAAGELRANGMRHATGNVVFLLDGDRAIDEALVDSILVSTAHDDPQ